MAFNKFINPRLLILNTVVFGSLILSAEVFIHIASYVKHNVIKKEKRVELSSDLNNKIPVNWRFGLHPSVGDAHLIDDFKVSPNTKNQDFNNLAAIYNYGIEGKRIIKVLVLGGSTTDPLGTHVSGLRGTWPDYLFKDLGSKYSFKFSLTNAGNGGTTSSNELSRLITLSHENFYDIVISYNGLNAIYFVDAPQLKRPENVLASRMVVEAIDMGIIKTIDNSTFINISNPLKPIKTYFYILISKSKIYQHLSNFRKRKIRSITPVNDIYELSQMEKKELDYASEKWYKNTKFMNAISKENGSKYFSILQPTLGLNDMRCSKDISQECLLDLRLNSYKEYHAKINYLYKNLRTKCNAIDYCIDLSNLDALTSDQNLYSDTRHPNSKGNQIIARKMLKILEPTISNFKDKS